MARYIDADAVIKEIEDAQDSLKSNNDAMWEINKKYYKGLCWAHGIVDDTPAADVAPRAEVERLTYILHCYALQYGTVTDKKKVINEAKAEVAREIFEEIEQEILGAIDNNLQRMAEQDSQNEIWLMCVAKKNTLCGIYDFIAELKNKYTGGD